MEKLTNASILQKTVLLIAILLFTAGLFLFFSKINIPATKSQSTAGSITPQTKFTAKEVPELAEILGPDQETRLKAGRKLVERVGVEDALEILEHSDLPHTGEGHLVVHQIGFYAYNKYGLDAILHCKDYFLQACYHGAIIEAASSGGLDIIGKMADRCKPSNVRYFQCDHAAGHAINAIWNYDLKSALNTCDDIFEKETQQYPEALTSCHNGAFMENLFGVHDWGTGTAPKRDWLSDDPYFPCNAFGEKYQKGCWLNQAARIYQMENGDIKKTAKICADIKNNQYIAWCMDNLSRQIHALTNGQISQVFSLCAEEGSYWRENCIVINAGSYYSVGDFNSALIICNQLTQNPHDACMQQLVSQIAGDNTDSYEKRNRCQKIGGNYGNSCISQIH